MRRTIGSLVGGILGLVLGAALILYLMSASESRREARGEVGPSAAQAEAIYVLLGFLLIPVSTVAGVAIGRSVGRRLTPEPRPPADIWSPPGTTEVNRAITGLGPAPTGRDGDAPPPA